MELNVSEAGTGAVRSGDMGAERWDLISACAISQVAAWADFNLYSKNPLLLIEQARGLCLAFLGGERNTDDNRPLLPYAAQCVLVAASKIDDPECYDRLKETSRPWGFASINHLPHGGMKRLASTYGEGATKYCMHNYLHGFQVYSLLNNTIKHLNSYLSGFRHEDDLGHATWGIVTAIHMFALRPDMATMLLGPDYGLTDEIRKAHEEHASRRNAARQRASESKPGPGSASAGGSERMPNLAPEAWLPGAGSPPSGLGLKKS